MKTFSPLACRIVVSIMYSAIICGVFSIKNIQCVHNKSHVTVLIHCCHFETGCHVGSWLCRSNYMDKAGLKVTKINLFLPNKYWDYKHQPHHSDIVLLLNNVAFTRLNNLIDCSHCSLWRSPTDCKPGCPWAHRSYLLSSLECWNKNCVPPYQARWNRFKFNFHFWTWLCEWIH